MRVLVRVEFRGESFDLYPGDLIGRSDAAALTLSEPSVSEAHALVSVRRGSLWLLSLRRLVAVRGEPKSELPLRPGLVLEFADGVHVRVLDVQQPEHVLALEEQSLGRRLLPNVASLWAGPPVRMLDRFVPGADAHLWWRGEHWEIRLDGEQARPLQPDSTFTLGTACIEVLSLPVAKLEQTMTRPEGGVSAPLRIVAHYDSVEFHRKARPAFTVGGIGARIISELVLLDGPVDWSVVATEVWGHAEPAELRHRWDVALGRLRNKLRAGGLRGDLLRADGTGRIQLALNPHDVAENRT
ncbi:MAG: hypothetical protein AAGA54_17885 [Myxococcota bacterium]